MIQKNASRLKETSFKGNIMKESCEHFYDYEGEFMKSLNEKHNLIGFKNGVYDLDNEDLHFRPGRPEDHITMSTNIEYEEYDEDHPGVQEIRLFMSQILPNENVRELSTVLTLLASFLHVAQNQKSFTFGLVVVMANLVSRII